MYYLNFNKFFSNIKDQENLDSYFEKLSEHSIKKVKLYLIRVNQFNFDNIILKLLELPNLKANLEEIEIDSTYVFYINNFIEGWNEYNQFAKLNKVTFTCGKLKSYDYKKIKDNTRKYFRQFRRYKDSLICSDIISAVHPQSSEENES